MCGQPLRRLPLKAGLEAFLTKLRDRWGRCMYSPPELLAPSKGLQRTTLRVPATVIKQAKATSGPISVNEEHLYFGTHVA